jgi:hypothetical protein
MYKLAVAVLLMLSSAPAFAQNDDAFRDCAPIGQSAKGELIYAMDCKALKAENRSTDYQPKMPPTDMKETVIPKSGGEQTPETTRTTGVNK